MMASAPPATAALSTWDRARAMAIVALCAAITVAGPGRWILAPDDPQGSISVLSCSLGWLIIPLCAVLAFVLSALATWLGGGKLEELGVLSASAALAFAALHHENARLLWLYVGQGQDTGRTGLALSLTLETIGWVAVMAAAWLGCLVPGRRAAVVRAALPRQELQPGILTVLAMSTIAAVLIPLLSSGTELAPIDTGQVYFCVLAAFFVASLVAYQLTGAHSTVWAFCSVALVATGGYVYTAFCPTPEFPGRQISHLMQLPPSDYARALPVQVVTAGLAAAILGNWQQRHITSYAAQESGLSLKVGE